MKTKLPCAFLVLLAAPAVCVPPAPPSPDALNAVQGLIRSMNTKDYVAYSGKLADNFVGHAVGEREPQSREVWLRDTRAAFDKESFKVSVTKVYFGSTTHGPFRQQVMLVEQITDFPLLGSLRSDCCSFFLTETLTLEGSKIVQIDRSPLFMTELSTTGERTDLRGSGR